LAVASLALTGCAGAWMDRAKTDCGQFGYVKGSPQYNQCVERNYSQMRSQFAKSVAASSSNSVTCVRQGMFTHCN
jgi:hypothetical protein